MTLRRMKTEEFWGFVILFEMLPMENAETRESFELLISVSGFVKFSNSSAPLLF